MKDIENKEEIYELQKWNLIGPQLTNTLSMLVLFLPSLFKEFYMSDHMFFLFGLIILSNCFTTTYFVKQLNKYDIKEDGNKTIQTIQIIVNVLLFIFLIVVTIKNILFKFF